MIVPDGRTMDYAIWRACERYGILPPEVKSSWDECHPWVAAMLLGYDQIRQVEECKRDADMIKYGGRF